MSVCTIVLNLYIIYFFTRVEVDKISQENNNSPGIKSILCLFTGYVLPVYQVSSKTVQPLRRKEGTNIQKTFTFIIFIVWIRLRSISCYYFCLKMLLFFFFPVLCLSVDVVLNSSIYEDYYSKLCVS